MSEMTNLVGAELFGLDEQMGGVETKQRVTYYTHEQIDKAIDITIDIFKKLPNIDSNRIQKQIDVSRECLYKFSDGIDNVVISAPTGFGKSILNFFITITLRVLEENFDSKTNGELTLFKEVFGNFGSYIMTSNKFLQDQYNDDIKRFDLNTHKLLKGKSNYNCNQHRKLFENKNNNSLNFGGRDKVDYVPQPFDKAKCKDSSLTKLIINGDNGKFPCAEGCDYLNARIDAINAETTVFNYSYFVSTMNMVYEMIKGDAPFEPRAITSFDECHVITGVLSDSFALSFDFSNIVYKVRQISLKLANYGVIDWLEQKYGVLGDGFKDFNIEMLKISMLYEKSKSEYNMIRDVEDLYDTPENNELAVNVIINNLIKVISDLSKAYRELKTDEMKFALMSSYDEIVKEFSEILLDVGSQNSILKSQRNIYRELGYDTAVIYIDEDKMNAQRRRMVDGFVDAILTFKCIDESELLKTKALKYTNKTIFMSATIGRPSDYIKMLKIENAHAIDVESDFDYSNSPIYKVQPEIWLNNKNMESEFPKILGRIEQIVNHDLNKNVRGIIHTPSHKMAKQIVDGIFDKRFVFVDTRNKNEMLERLKSDDYQNLILVGASLVEGVDLKDDLCRFMIFPKVMYPSLMDKLIKKKMKKIKGWYEYVTFVQYQQGLGRGVRHKNDWCRTYLLDGNFNKFDKNAVTPTIVSDRYIETPISDLHKNLTAEKDLEYQKRLVEFEAMLG